MSRVHADGTSWSVLPQKGVWIVGAGKSRAFSCLATKMKLTGRVKTTDVPGSGMGGEAFRILLGGADISQKMCVCL